MTDPSTLAGELSDEERGALLDVRNSDNDTIYRLVDEGLLRLPADLRKPAELTPLGLAVAKHLERSPPQPHSQTSQPDNGRDD